MEKLPKEGVFKITSFLSLKDKLNLACFSKKLYTIISENTLYTKLVFKDRVKFHQAMDLHQKTNFGHQVRQLTIAKSMEYDQQILSSLSTVFPDVCALEIKNGYGFDPSERNIQQFGMLLDDWDNWEEFEDIVDSSFLTTSLKLWSFNHLDILEIDCQSRCYSMTRTLMNAIHNAPTLEKLVLSNIKIKIVDVERLHTGAINLKYLELRSGEIYIDERLENHQVSYEPAESIKTFFLTSMKRTTYGFGNEGKLYDNAIQSWISYIGRKYSQLQHLELSLAFYAEDDSGWHFIWEKRAIAKSMEVALANLKHVKIYLVHVFPPTQRMLDAMTENNVQLEKFGFSLDDSDAIEGTFKRIQSAQAVSAIKSLSLSISFEDDPLIMFPSLTNLCFHLKNLTGLKIACENLTNDLPLVLLSVLQNLTMLKSLVFEALLITDEEEVRDLIYDKVSNNRIIARLESISLLDFVIDGSIDAEFYGNSLKMGNLLFNFIFRSCPNLKKVELQAGEFYDVTGRLYFDFRENHFLQHIDLDMPKCQYYTFHHEPRKYWRSRNDQIMQLDLTREKKKDLPYHVNLAWDTSKFVKLHLAGCGL